jgi:hypothetical protein
MAAPAGLSGSVPEPRHPETANPEPGATEPVAAQPVAAQSAAAQSAAAQSAAAQSAAAQSAAPGAAAPGAAAVELTAAVPKAAGPPDTELPDTELPDTELPDTGPDTGPPDAELPDAELPDAELPDTGPDGQAHAEGTAAVSHPDLGPEPEDAQPAERADKVRKIRPLVVAATVVGIIALVGVAVAVLAVVTHGFRPKTVVTYRVPAIFSLRPGDCINSAPNGLSPTVLSCATPHDAEVFATFSLAGSSWPGNAVVQGEAGSGCVSRIGGYLNPAFAEAGFAQEYIYPDQSAWYAGVRTVVCEVRASSGQLTGSVRKGA